MDDVIRIKYVIRQIKPQNKHFENTYRSFDA